MLCMGREVHWVCTIRLKILFALIIEHFIRWHLFIYSGGELDSVLEKWRRQSEAFEDNALQLEPILTQRCVLLQLTQGVTAWRGHTENIHQARVKHLEQLVNWGRNTGAHQVQQKFMRLC